MENEQLTLSGVASTSSASDKMEGYSPKEQELIRQLVQERLG